jgi:hypothetical protein
MLVQLDAFSSQYHVLQKNVSALHQGFNRAGPTTDLRENMEIDLAPSTIDGLTQPRRFALSTFNVKVASSTEGLNARLDDFAAQFRTLRRWDRSTILLTDPYPGVPGKTYFKSLFGSTLATLEKSYKTVSLLAGNQYRSQCAKPWRRS